MKAVDGCWFAFRCRRKRRSSAFGVTARLLCRRSPQKRLRPKGHLLQMNTSVTVPTICLIAPEETADNVAFLRMLWRLQMPRISLLKIKILMNTDCLQRGCNNSNYKHAFYVFSGKIDIFFLLFTSKRLCDAHNCLVASKLFFINFSPWLQLLPVRRGLVHWGTVTLLFRIWSIVQLCMAQGRVPGFRYNNLKLS